ncbi:hypothetical protein EYF80_007926 [Liparis tanakae]|uniref:Uncharacterized protein n=1 Tax=Liparis tanakae TaxID=230148 RepID=A0A4Z2IVL9_9TELE|nr:hypothetical protein EYF80_007926 [Liparis tanakae]
MPVSPVAHMDLHLNREFTLHPDRNKSSRKKVEHPVHLIVPHSLHLVLTPFSPASDHLVLHALEQGTYLLKDIGKLAKNIFLQVVECLRKKTEGILDNQSHSPGLKEPPPGWPVGGRGPLDTRGVGKGECDLAAATVNLGFLNSRCFASPRDLDCPSCNASYSDEIAAL